MASKYVIEVKGWPDHPHAYTTHTEQEAQLKAVELVQASSAEGVDLHPQGGRHHGKTEHWSGKNADGHPREIKIVVGEAHVS